MSSATSLASVTEIIVCTTCRPEGASRELPSAGSVLFEAVLALQQTELPVGIQVRGIACMSGCSRACTVAFQAAGKPTYYFGDLVADAETAEHVLACGLLHARNADGALLRSLRPERLRGGILAKLPPMLTLPPTESAVAEAAVSTVVAVA
jgi:predicted metal-binding protein